MAVCGVAIAAQSLPSQMPSAARRPIRIPIRSADPWYVKAMLEGLSPSAPEISTILNTLGGGGAQGGQRGAGGGQAGPGGNQGGGQNNLMRGGKFIVNPTDNSLWWYPD